MMGTMARRTTRKKPRRSRRKQPFNLVNAAELYMQTAVITNNVMGTNPFTALTGMEYGQTGVRARVVLRLWAMATCLKPQALPSRNC